MIDTIQNGAIALLAVTAIMQTLRMNRHVRAEAERDAWRYRP